MIWQVGMIEGDRPCGRPARRLSDNRRTTVQLCSARGCPTSIEQEDIEKNRLAQQPHAMRHEF